MSKSKMLRYKEGYLTSMAQRENLCRVSERDGTFANRVESRKQVDEEANKDNMSCRGRDERAKTCGQQRPRQMRKGEEEQSAPAPRIDRI